MTSTSVTRLYRFAASHRLHSPKFTEEENDRLYGKCNNPYGHGHDYELEVTFSGNINEQTGLLMPLAPLDKWVQSRVLAKFSHRNMNTDLEQFHEIVPTTENLLKVIFELLDRDWPFACQLTRLHLQETGRNGFELVVPASTIGNQETI